MMNSSSGKTASVGIVGCGWLGVATAQALIQLGAQVRGSTTRAERLRALASIQIEPVLLRLDGSTGTYEPSPQLYDLFSSDCLIVNIPPTSAGLDPESHERQIEELMKMAGQPVRFKQLIFVSSTSVYGQHQGRVDETTTPLPDENGNGTTLLLAEARLKKFAQELGFGLTIVRAAGLVGPGRHPGFFLAGRQGVANGNQAINLVHQNDLSRALSLLAISNDLPDPLSPRIFNAVASTHPRRADFYPMAAQALGVEPPTFKTESNDSGKIVSGKALLKHLGIEFKIDDWIAFVSEKTS